ncbi:TetR family transcriptional regulator [Acetobacter malorum]|uniref:TetR family transcriptional regulator n=1 Tax=Acetobacter malorum TaxID=178901 RepID=A0A177G5L3_9PROT|nr:hypothetical protein [Acetobacter malorum]OAG75623.1 TetR family transcriptional regulator [Acetobacter malorum]
MPRTLLLRYELYASAASKPELATIMRDWMQARWEALGRFFDPLVQGMGIHGSVDHAKLDRGQIEDVIRRFCTLQ